MNAPYQFRPEAEVTANFLAKGGQFHAETLAPVVTKENAELHAEISALIKESQELETTVLPPDEAIDSPSGLLKKFEPASQLEGINLSPKEKSRLSKIAYCRRYRVNHKSKNLEKKKAVLQPYLAKKKDVVGRMQLFDNKLDELIATYGKAGSSVDLHQRGNP